MHHVSATKMSVLGVSRQASVSPSLHIWPSSRMAHVLSGSTA